MGLMARPISPRPNPSHPAWRCPGLRALLEAIRAVREREASSPPATLQNAIGAALDAHARAHGWTRAGTPRRWMTAREYAAWRREEPGYRLDPARHVDAAMTIPERVRRERAAAGGSARRETA